MAKSEITDFALLQRWGGGDREAGAQLVDRYFTAIHRFFRARARHGIDDLVQETFLACVEARARFRADSSFRTFLFAIGRNVLRSHYRSVTRGDDQTSLPLSQLPDSATTPTQRIGRAERAIALHDALARLPQEQRRVLELTFWDGLSGPEIATVLGVPLDTAYTRIRRARLKLREQLPYDSSDPLSAEL